jgi:hypothetical protein
MYTNPTNVPEESVESILSFEADTENIPCIGSFTSLIPSQAPFQGRNLFSVPYSSVVVHIRLLVLECNLLVSLFSYLLGDINTKYILGIPEGCSLGRSPVFFFWAWMGGIISSPIIHVRTSKGFRCYVHVADHVRVADCQVTPSGVIDPLRTSPGIPASLLVYVLCVLKLPPQVGSWAVYLQACQLLPPQAGSWVASPQCPTGYQYAWPLAKYLPKILPKIPATGMVEAA